MAFEKKDNSGSAFKNTRKAAETHADYTGDCLIDGQEYWINTWVRKTKEGAPYFSHSFRKKQPRPDSGTPAKTQSKHDIELSDDIPF